jgi:hypothetical protein
MRPRASCEAVQGRKSPQPKLEANGSKVWNGSVYDAAMLEGCFS